MKQLILSFLFFFSMPLPAPQQCILILGMHRSGTSALSGVLNIMGLDLGDFLYGPDSNNPKGYFEDVQINSLNSAILEAYGSSWDDIKKINLYCDKELFNHCKTEVKKLIINKLNNKELFGFKDPRICVLLPIYLKALKELQIDVKIIVAKRKPEEIAASLHKRDNLPLEVGLALAKKHLKFINRYAGNYKNLIIHFDDLINNTNQVFQEIHQFIPQLNNSEETFANVINFIDKDLKHHSIIKRTIKSLDTCLTSKV